MSTNFSHWNTTIEPFVQVSRISTSSPNSSFGLSKDVIIIPETLLFYKKSFRKALHLTRRFIPIAKAGGILGKEDKVVFGRRKDKWLFC